MTPHWSSVLKELFEKRQGGDYELDVVLTQDDATATVVQATAFLAEVRQYLIDKGLLS